MPSEERREVHKTKWMTRVPIPTQRVILSRRLGSFFAAVGGWVGVGVGVGVGTHNLSIYDHCKCKGAHGTPGMSIYDHCKSQVRNRVHTVLTTCLYMTTVNQRVSPVPTTCLYMTAVSHRVPTVLTTCLYMTDVSHKVPMYSPVGCTPPNQAKHKEAAQREKICCTSRRAVFWWPFRAPVSHKRGAAGHKKLGLFAWR